LLPSCLNTTAGLLKASASVNGDDAHDNGIIHVGFYDTRRSPDVAGMRRAAAVCNRSGVRFHALLAHPVAVVGMRVTRLELAQPFGRCLHANLRRLTYSTGHEYLFKPLLHLLLPDVRRLILLDTDVVVLRDLGDLWAHFERFGEEAVVGLAEEQSHSYSSWRGIERVRGVNGGVQLLHLDRMRHSSRYLAALDHHANGADGRWIGELGDQTLYSFIAYSDPPLVHILPCSWNRQLGPATRRGYGARNHSLHSCACSRHPCPRLDPTRKTCALLHANYPAIKCVARLMQRDRSCATWRKIRLGHTAGCRPNRFPEFRYAANTFFANCCTDM
jgi:xylosyl alpha-1,3-xylosyltransferase